jgi:1-aminocyclopropane-1-carboxylate deaminase/D-cysteine desulfhydrase-like pyridoxal-dependent ACC family enzyme
VSATIAQPHDRPRLALGSFPTPLEPAPRLGEQLGVRLTVKREDCSGLLLGGNKVRKLELLLASEPYASADVWITVGGVQSNHARETAAAAARLGRRCVLLLTGDPPAQPANGNLLLFELLGAELRFLGDGADDAMVASAARQSIGELADDGYTSAFVPVGAAHPLGVTAWAEGMAEALAQLDALGERVDHVVLSAGTGSTAAGCALELAQRGLSVPVWGISANWDVARLAAATGALLPIAAADAAAAARAVRLLQWDERQVGPGYTVATPAARAALRRLAGAGLMGDLTYTAKAFAGLQQLVREGSIGAGASVLFLHTGASPETFARPRADVIEQGGAR